LKPKPRNAQCWFVSFEYDYFVSIVPNLTLQAIGCEPCEQGCRALVPMESMSPKAGKRLEALRWVKVETATADDKLAFDHQTIIERTVSDLQTAVRG
jgi:hypothetical protein